MYTRIQTTYIIYNDPLVHYKCSSHNYTGYEVSISCDQFEPDMFVNLLIFKPGTSGEFKLRLLEDEDEDDNFYALQIFPDYEQKVGLHNYSNLLNVYCVYWVQVELVFNRMLLKYH